MPDCYLQELVFACARVVIKNGRKTRRVGLEKTQKVVSHVSCTCVQVVVFYA